MMSPDLRPSDEVLSDLGEGFVHAVLDAVDGAREDFDAFKEWQPSWVPGFTGRFTANFLHERIWDRLIRAVDGTDGIRVVDHEPVRELRSGTAYVIRVKRHHPGDRISVYPTDGARAFWSNEVLTFDGLESHSLALGYYWDAELRAMGDAVLSFRDGKDHPVWAVRLQRDAGTATGFSWRPIQPDLPEVDLSGVLGEPGVESHG